MKAELQKISNAVIDYDNGKDHGWLKPKSKPFLEWQEIDIFAFVNTML
jgi:hypothetical protein